MSRAVGLSSNGLTFWVIPVGTPPYFLALRNNVFKNAAEYSFWKRR